ncbi:MAG: hypothetical protein IJ228_05195 [Succinivibrio sp.]|nr:hypothetical protein [Succinivibrio sp.]
MSENNPQDPDVKQACFDGTFRAVFSEPINALELCNAIYGTQVQDTGAVEIVTLEDSPIFRGGYRNDLGVTFGEHALLLTEHQSTKPANMPIRMAIYVLATLLQLLQKTEKQWRRIYGEKGIKIPSPRLICVYQGSAQKDAVEVLRLSDHFEEGSVSDLQLSVTVYNINHPDCPLNRSCQKIWEYGEFYRIYQEYLLKEEDRFQAMIKAIDECIAKNILGDFLKHNWRKVMIALNRETADRLYREEWYETGIETGKKLVLPQIEAALKSAYEAKLQAADEQKAREAAQRQAEQEQKAREQEQKARVAAEERIKELEEKLKKFEEQSNNQG